MERDSSIALATAIGLSISSTPSDKNYKTDVHEILRRGKISACTLGLHEWYIAEEAKHDDWDGKAKAPGFHKHEKGGQR